MKPVGLHPQSRRSGRSHRVMQLRELVEWVGLIAALKRGQPGGEVISALEIEQGFPKSPELLEGEGHDAGNGEGHRREPRPN